MKARTGEDLRVKDKGIERDQGLAGSNWRRTGVKKTEVGGNDEKAEDRR